MTDRSNARSLTALGLGFVLLMAIVFGTLWLVERQRTSFAWVKHTVEVQRELNEALAVLRAAQSSARAYIITSDDRYGLQFDRNAAALLPAIDALARRTADNPTQVRNSAELRRLAGIALAPIRSTNASMRAGDRAAAVALVESGEGEARVDALGRHIERMNAEEARLLAQREDELAVETQASQIALVVAGLLVFGLALLALRDLLARIRAARADAAMLAANNRELTDQMIRREAAEGQVRHLQKVEAIGQLTGGIAHDFNNMLTIVIGSLDLAKRRITSDPAKAEQSIDNASEGARRAAQLTARLLAFSRQQPLQPEAVDANKLVGSMSELLRRTLGETLRVETVLAGGLWADQGRPE